MSMWVCMSKILWLQVTGQTKARIATKFPGQPDRFGLKNTTVVRSNAFYLVLNLINKKKDPIYAGVRHVSKNESNCRGTSKLQNCGTFAY